MDLRYRHMCRYVEQVTSSEYLRTAQASQQMKKRI